jgi:hypothetical protein
LFQRSFGQGIISRFIVDIAALALNRPIGLDQLIVDPDVFGIGPDRKEQPDRLLRIGQFERDQEPNAGAAFDQRRIIALIAVKLGGKSLAIQHWLARCIERDEFDLPALVHLQGARRTFGQVDRGPEQQLRCNQKQGRIKPALHSHDWLPPAPARLGPMCCAA